MLGGYTERQVGGTDARDGAFAGGRRHGDAIRRWSGGQRQPRDGLVFEQRAGGLLRCIGAQSGGATDETPGEARIASRRGTLAAQRARRGRRERSGEQES